MLKRLSLKTKVLLAAGLPAFCYVVAASFAIKNIYSNLSSANTTVEDMKIVMSTYPLIKALQTERGQSLGVLTGTASKETLIEAREHLDKLAQSLKQQILKVDGLRYAELGKAIDQALELRKSIDNRSASTEEILNHYSESIYDIGQRSRMYAEKTELANVSLALQNAGDLEHAREMGGQLRGKLLTTITSRKSVPPKQVADIVQTATGIDVLVHDLSSELDPDVAARMETFSKSDEMESIHKIVYKFIENAERGDFSLDPKVVYSTISQTLDFLSSLMEKQYSYTSALLDAQVKELYRALIIQISFLTAILIFLAIVLTSLTQSLSRSMSDAINKLVARSEMVSSAATQVLSSSSELSNLTTSLASSVQETVSSVNQIESMVQKNTDSAEKGESASQESRTNVEQGKTAVDEMIQSIAEISSSSESIVNQVVEGNKKLEEILRVIADIENKTKVINEIVFQTKLLSFNASVEAARAGEHGKGFSVVAEEVGNLADMSGKAAKEISSLLTESVTKVNGIVQETGSKVDQLVGSTKKTIAHGLSRAKECETALEQISGGVHHVSDMMSSISASSKEQSSGVQEINKAMQEIDTVTQKNNYIASESSTAARRLQEQAEALNAVVEELKVFTYGYGGEEKVATKKRSLPPSTPSKTASKAVLSLAEFRPKNAKTKTQAKPEVKKIERRPEVRPEAPVKMVVGHDGETPSADDPGFNE